MAIITKCLTNNVPNVRLIAARSLRKIAKKYNSPALTEEAEKAIQGLADDPDKDIKLYVVECSNSW